LLQGKQIQIEFQTIERAANQNWHPSRWKGTDQNWPWPPSL